MLSLQTCCDNCVNYVNLCELDTFFFLIITVPGLYTRNIALCKIKFNVLHLIQNNHHVRVVLTVLNS